MKDYEVILNVYKMYYAEAVHILCKTNDKDWADSTFENFEAVKDALTSVAKMSLDEKDMKYLEEQMKVFFRDVDVLYDKVMGHDD